MTPDETASEEKSSRSYWGFVLWPVAGVVLYLLSAGFVPLFAAYIPYEQSERYAHGENVEVHLLLALGSIVIIGLMIRYIRKVKSENRRSGKNKKE